jgi:hypothetical protein
MIDKPFSKPAIQSFLSSGIGDVELGMSKLMGGMVAEPCVHGI